EPVGGIVQGFANAITNNLRSVDARRADLANNLKATLQNKLNVAPTDTANGGFELTVDSAHLELYPMPDWKITIYNFTIGQKEESPGFKKLYDSVAQAWNIAITRDYAEAGDNKPSARADSAAGKLVLTKDTTRSLM